MGSRSKSGPGKWPTQRASTQRASTQRRRIDARFLVGIALVLVSAFGVWLLISGLDRATDIYLVRSTVTAGDRVSPDDVVPVHVALGQNTANYLAPGDIPEHGVTMTRTVFSGELLPRSAVSSSGSPDTATVVVPAQQHLPSTTEKGAHVEVWAAPTSNGRATSPPIVLVADAQIADVIEKSAFAATDDGGVELVIPRDRLATTLQAIAAEADITLVSVSQPAGTREDE